MGRHETIVDLVNKQIAKDFAEQRDIITTDLILRDIARTGGKAEQVYVNARELGKSFTEAVAIMNLYNKTVDTR